MDYVITPLTADDREQVMEIFNYYIEHSFAAYRENRLPPEAYDHFLESSQRYPNGVIRNSTGKTMGFGLLRPHKPVQEFAHTAEVTYFLHPDHRGAGLGKALLQLLEKGAREMAITNLLAHISSLNPQSLVFHEKNGFSECGRFVNIGRKKGRLFDIVWMQKLL